MRAAKSLAVVFASASASASASGSRLAIALASAGLALLAPLAGGCAASEIEPRSAATLEGDAWDPFAPDLAKLAPPGMQAPVAPGAEGTPAPATASMGETMSAPPPFESDPAPIRERPRSISLGYIGDEPLTPSAPSAPRWPWVAEPFHSDRWSYGGRPVYRRRW